MKVVQDSCSVSHDHSEIILLCWFAAQERLIIIIISDENRINSVVEIVYLFGNHAIFVRIVDE